MSGGIVASRHYSIGTDSMNNLGGFDNTSKAMDPFGCGEMLNEIIEWMDNDVDKIREKYPEGLRGRPEARQHRARRRREHEQAHPGRAHDGREQVEVQ
eukprot:98258-Prymnesium_polylepis.1